MENRTNYYGFGRYALLLGFLLHVLIHFQTVVDESASIFMMRIAAMNDVEVAALQIFDYLCCSGAIQRFNK